MTKTRDQSFNLEDRTVLFSEKLIKLCQKIKLTPISSPIINQLIRSGTSVGANYHEANGASSKKDFRNKIFISKKEAKETQYWLSLIENIVEKDLMDELSQIRQEAVELGMIFSSIAKNTKIE